MSGKAAMGAAVVGVAALSSLATLFISTRLHPARDQTSCSKHRIDSFPQHSPRWDSTERLNIIEKGVSVARLGSQQKCYIMPLSQQGISSEGRPLEIVRQALSDEIVEELAGLDALQFCKDRDTFLLRDPVALEQSRFKRSPEGEEKEEKADEDEGDDGEEEKGAPDDGEAAAEDGEGEGKEEGGGAASDGDGRPSGLDLEYEKRVPRCMDLVVECKDKIGEVQTCYTWINGIVQAGIKCESATEFKLLMTKPSGRILKIAQQQWKLCLERRKEGKRC